MAPDPSGMPTPRLVPGGLRAHRQQLRRFGGPAALAIPLALAVIGTILLRGSTSSIRGGLGFGSIVFAAPTMPLFGVPVRTGALRYALAAVTSAVTWLVVGLLAAGRALQRPVASWPEWRREYIPLVAGVWVGALGALGIAGVAAKFGAI